MITIEAVVRNGRIEVDRPIELPDGTRLLIPLPETNESSKKGRKRCNDGEGR
jgi:hypothetical protein